MTTTATYRMAGLQASATASRPRAGVAGLAAAKSPCAWSKDQTIKATTGMFVNVLDHPSRRLWNPSP